MKFSTLLTGAFFDLTSSGMTYGARSFSGSNLKQTKPPLLEGLESAGVKVLRVWLDGQSETTKGTPIDPFPALHGDSPSAWNNTVLNRLDKFMVKANSYGIKLLASIHSYNAFEGNKDFYGKWYGTGCFYTNSDAITHFKDRIAHLLARVNPANGKTWAQSSEYIFAFEAQNESMHPQGNAAVLASWQCTMVQSLKSELSCNTNILVTTGGGAYLNNSLFDPYFSCDALDVLTIHAYGVADFGTTQLKIHVDHAICSNKELIMQEWGACYTDAPNENCIGDSPISTGARDANIKKWAAQIDAAGIPWFYWRILPNSDPHQDWDYEIGINDISWDTLKQAGLAAGSAESAFDFGQ